MEVSQGSGVCAALCIRRLCVLDMWRLVHQLSFFCGLTVFFWRLIYCWYSLGRHVTIGTPMVIFALLTVFWLFLTNGTLYQSSKTLKAIGVPIVTGLPRLYQQCTNREQKAQLSLTNRSMQLSLTNRSMLVCTVVDVWQNFLSEYAHNKFTLKTVD